MASESAQNEHYRSILPAISAGLLSDATHRGSDLRQSLPPRRKKVPAACDGCRESRTMCNGQFPCTNCSRKRQSCTYTKQRSNAGQLLQRLRTLPYEEAIQLLKRIRPPESNSPRPSPALSASQMPAQNSMEFELINRHAIAYPPIFPLQASSLPLSDLLRPTRLPTHQRQWCSSDWTNMTNCDFDMPTHTASSSESSPPSGPVAPKALVDDRLNHVDLSYWTGIPVPYSLAINAMSLYFEIDYPLLPMFDVHLFLEDLVHKRHQYCSRFLVACLLCWSFLPYIAIDSDSAALSAAFYNAARMLVSQEITQETITAVAALQLLSVSAAAYGQDKFGIWLVEEGVKMGRRMGLLGTPSDAGSSWFHRYDDKDWKKAVSFTAWGVFNWVSLHCLHYQTAEVEVPTIVPIPGDTLSGAGADASTGHTKFYRNDLPAFAACCRLWTIFNDVLWEYYSTPLIFVPSVEFAEGIFGRLLSWAASLPIALARGDQNSHVETIMHMQFHAIVTDVFRPFLQTPLQSQRLASFSSSQAFPGAIYAASVSQLKRLLLTFRQKFKTAAFSIFWQTGLIYVSNAMVRESGTQTPEWRFYLELCLAGMEDLHGSFRTSRAAAQALLALALQQGAFSYAEARRVLFELQEIGRHHTAALHGAREDEEQTVEASWVLDLGLAVVDHDAAQAGRGADRLQEMLLMEEFTTVVGE